jgi:hypothetical protein
VARECWYTVVEEIEAAVNPEASIEEFGCRITRRENFIGGRHG